MLAAREIGIVPCGTFGNVASETKEFNMSSTWVAISRPCAPNYNVPRGTNKIFAPSWRLFARFPPFHVKHLASLPRVCYFPSVWGTALARVIAIANQKGGVGKTTTAVNLAACLAAAEQPTLLIDCDSQANATAAIGFQKDPSRHTIYHALILGEPLDKIVQKSQVERLDVLPADKNLAGAAVELVNAEQREYKLQAYLQPVRD